MTKNLRAFLAANKRSPVIDGQAIGIGGEGAVYHLKNGRSFRLNREECAAMAVPRWDLPEA